MRIIGSRWLMGPTFRQSLPREDSDQTEIGIEHDPGCVARCASSSASFGPKRKRRAQAGRRRKRLVAASRSQPLQPMGMIPMKSKVVQLHRYKDPAAYRPQPARGGSDFWPTIDRGLIQVLLYEVLPALPIDVIWEAAAGAGHLVDPLRATRCQVIATDLFPDPERPDIAVHDFLHAPPPNAGAGTIMITNPPNSKTGQPAD